MSMVSNLVRNLRFAPKSRPDSQTPSTNPAPLRNCRIADLTSPDFQAEPF